MFSSMQFLHYTFIFMFYSFSVLIVLQVILHFQYLSFRLNKESTIEEQFLKEKCSVYTIVISSSKGSLARSLRLYADSPLDKYG